MTGRRDSGRHQEVKLTSQLNRGDLIALDGLGGFTVTSVEPYGTDALIKLATANLAVICARNVRWSAIASDVPVWLHGYQACDACHGKGIVLASHGDGTRPGTPAAPAGSPSDPNHPGRPRHAPGPATQPRKEATPS